MRIGRQQRRVTAILKVMTLLTIGSVVTTSCQENATAPTTKANEERWKNFENTNKKDVSAAMSSYEKRQAQLAAKKTAGPKPAATPNAPSSNTVPTTKIAH
jgi:hypothetical protein